MGRDSSSVSRRPSSASRGYRCADRDSIGHAVEKLPTDPRRSNSFEHIIRTCRHHWAEARNYRFVVALYPSKEVCEECFPGDVKSCADCTQSRWDVLCNLYFQRFLMAGQGSGLLLLRLGGGIGLICLAISGFLAMVGEPVSIVRDWSRLLRRFFGYGFMDASNGSVNYDRRVMDRALSVCFTPGRPVDSHPISSANRCCSDARPRRMVHRCTPLREEALRY
jgi:hypothetical protein